MRLYAIHIYKELLDLLQLSLNLIKLYDIQYFFLFYLKKRKNRDVSATV